MHGHIHRAMACADDRCGGGGGRVSCGGRGTYYHKLPGSRQPQEGGGSPPPRAWAFVRRTVARTVGFYARRRRWVARHMRRVRWAALWCKARRAVVLQRPAAASRGGSGRRAVTAGYDSASYSQNFDDGTWREEEEEYWRSGSFASRFGQSGRFAGLLDDG